MTSGEVGTIATVVIALALLWGLRGEKRSRRRNYEIDGSE